MTDTVWLRDEFPPEELKGFRGRGGMELTYVEDETVMDRLDAAHEVLHWDWHVEPVGADVVKGRLRIVWVEGGESEWEDFGYANNANSSEPLKEAATDAFRRVARMPGVARYVYAGKAPTPRRSVAAEVRDNAQRTAVTLAEPKRTLEERTGLTRGELTYRGDDPRNDLNEAWQEPENVTAAMELAETLPGAVPVCKRHKVPMKPSSKFGGFYCTAKDANGSWCKERVA